MNRPHTYRALIHLNFLFPEVRHLLEGVDGDEHRADVGLVRSDVKGENCKVKTDRVDRAQWGSGERVEFLQTSLDAKKVGIVGGLQ